MRAVQRLVARYLTEARINGASVQYLRNTIATYHIAAGTDLKTLQETLGHANLTTTAMYVSTQGPAGERTVITSGLDIEPTALFHISTSVLLLIRH